MMLLRTSFFAFSRALLLLAFLAVAFFGAADLQAANVNWLSTSNANWSTATNWSGTASGNTLNFNAGSYQLNTTNDLAAGTSFAGLAFGAGAGAYVLNGNSILLGGNIVNSGTNATMQTINFDIALSKAIQINANSSSVVLINGNISGAFAMTFNNGAGSDTGTIILAGSNSFTGAVSYKNAQTSVLRIANDYALGSTAAGTTLVAGNALEMTTNSSGQAISVGAEALSIAGTGVSNGGALRNLAGDNTYGGLLTLTAATRINSDSGTLSLTNTGTITGATFGLTLGGAGNIVINSIIGTTTGTLTKDGAGTLTLGGANTYTGDTIIGAGVGRLAGSGGIASGSRLVVSNGATFDFNGINDQVAGISGAGDIALGAATLTLSNTTAQTFSGSLGGAGSLVKLGAGTQVLSGATNSYGGTTTVGGGTLSVGTLANAGANSSIGTNATIIITNGGVLEYTGGTVSIDRGINLASGNGVIGVTNAATELTISGVISNTGALVKTNGGTLVLSGANTYSGATTVGAGVLRVANSDALGTTAAGTTVISGAALELSNTSVGAEALTLNGTGISAGGALRNVSGNNIYGGLITLGAASRINSDSGTLSLTNTGTITGATFGLTLGGAGNISIASIIGTTTGTLTKEGGGTATLLATNSFTGLTTISGGTLAYGIANALNTGAVTVNGANAVFDIGSFSDSVGAVTLTDGSITGTTGVLTGTSYSVQNGSISAMLSGTAVTLTKSGAGTVTLSGSNSYTGATTISAGALRAANNDALGTTAGNTTVATGTALELSGNISIGAEALSLVGTGISSGGALRNISGNNTYGGLITLGGATTINSDSGTLTLDVASGNAITGTADNLTFGGAGNVAVNDTIANTTATLTKTGAGTLTLAASNSYSGVTTLSAGTLRATTSANALGSGTLSLGGGILELANDTALNFGRNTTVAASMQISSERLSAGAGVTHTLGTLSIGAQTLTVGTDASVTSGTAGLTFGATTLSASGAVFSVNSGTLLTLGAMTGNTFGFTVTGAGNTTIGGIIGTTSGTVTKDGAGTLTLSAANTYTGATTISNGAVNIQNAAGLGTTATGTTVLSGGALELQNNITVGAETLSLSGTGVSGGGALRNVGGNNTYGGTITNVAAARINSDSGTMTLTGAINATNQLITFGGAGNIVVAGAITNSTNGLTKDGAGQLTLSNSNTYTGTTTVSAGTLAYGTNNAISSGAVTVDGGTLAIGAFSDSVGAVTLTSGSITGSTGVLTGTSYTVESGSISAILAGGVGLTKSTAGTVTLSGANTYSGATSINGGTLAFGSTAALTNSSAINMGGGTFLEYTGATAALNRNITVTNGTGTVRNTGGGTLTLSGGLSKDGTVLRFNTGTFNITGVISGASANSDLVVDAATVTLSNANTYNGPTFIRNAGVLNANVAGALPTNTRTALSLDDTGSGGSKLSLGANQVIASLTGADSSLVTLGANTLTVGTTSGSTIFNGIISGSGGLVKDGASTQVLTGSNSLSGPITISAGTLQIGNGTDAGSIASVSSISNNGVLSYQIGSGTRTLTAPISGTGSLLLNSPGGNVTISGANSYSGGTTLIAGELHAGTNSSFGTGALTLAGTNAAYIAHLHYANTASPLSVGALSLNGNSCIDLQTGTSVASTGIVSITSTNNCIAIAAGTWNTGTNTLVSGTSLSFGGGANIFLDGTAVNNSKVALGTTSTNGRTSYTFNTNATSFYVVVNGVAFDVVWSGAANSQWNTNSANWQQSTMGTNPSGTNITFVNADTVYFGNTATSNAITVASGIQAANMFVTNSTGTVALNGAQFSAYSLTKSGAGNLTVSNALVLLGNDVGVTNGTLLNSGSGNLTLAGNFTQGALIQSGAGTTTLAASNSFTGGVTASNGVVSATANNALGSGSVTVSGGTVDVGSTAQNVGLITLNSGSITGSGSLTTTSAVQAKDGTISAVIAGSGGLTKSTAGTVTLSGANTYTGLTHVTGGVLSVSANNNLGSATNGLHLQGGTLQTTGSFSSGRAVTMTTAGTFETASGTGLHLTGDFTGGGALTKSGAGSLTLSGNNASFSGNTALDAGTLRLGSANALGTGALTQGASTLLEIDTTGTIANTMTLRDVTFLQSATLSGGLTLNTATFTVNTNVNGLLTGVVTGTGGLAKAGTGTLSLSNANTYTGGTTISAGTLQVVAEGAIGGGDVANDGSLILQGNVGAITNTITGTGSLSKVAGTGSTTTELAGSVSNTFTGLTTVNGGTLRLNKSGGALAIGGDALVNGGVLILRGSEQIGDTATVTQTSGTFDFGTSYATGRTETIGSYVKSGGSFRTYGNTLNTGTFELGGSSTNITTINGLPTNAATAGTLIVRSAMTMTGADSPTLTIDSADGVTNRLVLQGNLTANVTAGTAQIVTAGAGSTAGQVDLDGGTRTVNVVNGSAATDLLVSATIANGGISKTGAGVLALSGNNTFSGVLDVQAGTVDLNSSTGAAAGSVSSVSVASGATLLVSQSDQVNNSATISLSGGTITRAGGVNEVFGDLTVTGSGFLNFGATSYANAGNVSFGTYAPSALLTINNFDFGSTLIFKTDLSSSINNTNFFAFNNGGFSSYSWDQGSSTFTITAIPEPSTYLAAAGLLAVMLWPSRRRLLKDAKKIFGLSAPMRDRLARRSIL